MKYKILMVSESSVLSSGYAVYTNELLKRLSSIPDFEVAELACFINPNDSRLQNVPWKVYVNKPDERNEQAYSIYSSDKSNEFGAFTFNEVCIDFQPTHVIDIRDFWMFSYQANSPFRDYYNWLIMPTVDAYPQNKEWLDYFKSADGVLTYSQFGERTLMYQCPEINLLGVASPAASDNFRPMNKMAIRKKYNIDHDAIIFGTVMRNQRRKLFPDLFDTFANFLNNSINTDNVFLYCHTGYPDLGWSIPELLIKYKLSDKVLFTYKCENCKFIDVGFFHDAIKQCNNCKHIASKLSCTSYPITESELSEIYNIFDIYIQYANSEGFGMPVVEAAKCGLPIIAVNYSAMESTADCLGQLTVEPLHLVKECETGCYRAVPNNHKLLSLLQCFTNPIDGKKNIEEAGKSALINANKIYNWDKCSLIWENAIRSTNKPCKPWDSEPNIHVPAYQLNIPDPLNQANFLICEVLNKPEWIGTFIWQRLINDLTYKSRIENMNYGFYFNENHERDLISRIPFSYNDAYKECISIREYYNMWEMHRVNHNAK